MPNRLSFLVACALTLIYAILQSDVGPLFVVRIVWPVLLGVKDTKDAGYIPGYVAATHQKW